MTELLNSFNVGVSQITEKPVYIHHVQFVDKINGIGIDTYVHRSKSNLLNLLSQLIEFHKSERTELLIDFQYGKIPLFKTNEEESKGIQLIINTIQDLVLNYDIDDTDAMAELMEQRIKRSMN